MRITGRAHLQNRPDNTQPQTKEKPHLTPMRSRCHWLRTGPVKHNAQNRTPNHPFHLQSWCGSVVACFGLAALLGCASTTSSPIQVSHRSFGQTPDGKEVSLFTLRNAKGAEGLISNYGGFSLSMPRSGRRSA